MLNIIRVIGLTVLFTMLGTLPLIPLALMGLPVEAFWVIIGVGALYALYRMIGYVYGGGYDEHNTAGTMVNDNGDYLYMKGGH